MVCNDIFNDLYFENKNWKYTEIMKMEQQTNEETIDDIGGCREGKNMIKNKTKRSGGLLTIQACNGIIFKLIPVLRTESPTLILQKFMECAYDDESLKKYFEHCVVVIGWDMMCNIMRTLLSERMKSFLFPSETNKTDQKPDDEVIKIYYIFMTFGLHKVFIDAYHAKFHKRIECKCKEGTFNVNNPKFCNIFGSEKNGNISEHLWVVLNKLRNIKQLCSEKYQLAVFLRKEMHNNDLKKKFEKEGYYWDSVLNFKKNMNISWADAEKWYNETLSYYLTLPENKESPPMNKIIPKYEEFIKDPKYVDKKINLIKRISLFHEAPEYINFWSNNTKFKENDDLVYMRKFLNAKMEQIFEELKDKLEAKGFTKDMMMKPKNTNVFRKHFKTKAQKLLKDDNKIDIKKYQSILNNGLDEYFDSKMEQIFT